MEQVALTSGIYIEKNAIHHNIQRLINQVYKLLPLRQQGQDWERALSITIEEIQGMKSLIGGQDQTFFKILCKLKGLFTLQNDSQRYIYRSIIFECLNLLTSLNGEIDVR